MSAKEELQSFFNKAYQGCLNQGVQSLKGCMCAYRGNNGTKCAIGQVLTDEMIAKYGIKDGTWVTENKDDWVKKIQELENPNSRWSDKEKYVSFVVESVAEVTVQVNVK